MLSQNPSAIRMRRHRARSAAMTCPVISEKFGRWTVIGGAVAFNINGRVRKAVTCRCECGVERPVIASNLLKGLSTSCGCARAEKTAARSTSHGQSGTKLYNIWGSMKARCHKVSDPAYPDYGGRGIVVCPRWHEFAHFAADMGEPPSHNHSLGRIDNDGNYEPSNCRWETLAQQARNKRSNIFLNVDGVQMCLKDAAIAKGIKRETLTDRIYKLGWNVEDALNTPVRPMSPSGKKGGAYER